ncbi:MULTISPECIES: hypothetical protein [Bacillales]|uniref:Membrane protein insertase YidC n=1 Tax=Brevibacillus aydinogluensis TaxID=927786 RepID=A0AA48MCD7_9BACL|nr:MULTISPECIES: hypothetical protein [Bacillales]MBR8658928.1 hypothetical protein [Brevibacillus sp. NL20B1]REK66941.1 MAG: hypothetical protein DF221_03495 [Brevibacillus sp.]MDT3416320.1 hypothetical protein [Brevibacillus aydinogluensis]NNV04446.1 hypothetical protein [Brevibacillus sp. MCWH]UFJ62646.1 hypothetical protein IRT44_07835 [Anoxybacillus sediminis]
MRSRGRRAWFAGIFALLILLMNVFPVVAVARPYVPNLGGGTYDVPKLPVPDLQAPQWDVPKLEAPQWDVPQLDVPKLEAPHWDVPQLDVPKLEAPRWDVPQLDVPKLEAPRWDVPDLQPRNGTVPTLKPPTMDVPDLRPPNISVPDLTPHSLKQDGRSAKPQPFTETLAYKLAELSYKEIIGGTLNYSKELVERGTVTAGQAGASYGKVLFRVGVKGLDIALQDTPYSDLPGLTLDGLDAKGAYDSYKFVFQRYAPANAGTVRVPGVVTGLNVAVAAISLPFDFFNMVGQFRQAYDPDLGEEKQNEKFVDGIGNLGSTLMDIGVITSTIPGWQAIAFACVATGFVLWAGARLVKWYNKASGGALSKRISSVRKGIGKVLGWFSS